MPGQEEGNALADVLFGDVNPSGRLALTIPHKENETLTHEQWPGVAFDEGGHNLQANFTEKLVVGYRWYSTHKQKPVYPFGHGLSYTSFSYSSLAVTGKNISCVIRNEGDVEGAEVAQLYI